MLLSDRDIKDLIKKGEIIVEPFDENLVQPCSLDIRLGNEFRIFESHNIPYIDPKEPDKYSKLIKCEDYIIIHPGEFVLGRTLEYIKLPNHIAATLEGRSSLGRMGIIIHATAGFVDPGFEGTLTLEISNLSNLPVKLYPGMKIGQLAFYKLSSPCEKPYCGKYKGQKPPESSKLYLELRGD
jgi:dCTP deaminase